MVYINSWTEYQAAAERLYEQSPKKTRYCVKYRGQAGVLILKVTDDTTCLKFKTKSSIVLNRFEAFNLILMTKMQNRRPRLPPMSAPATIAPTQQHASSAGAPAAQPGAPDAVTADANAAAGGSTVQAGASTGTAKKKKPKKKK